MKFERFMANVQLWFEFRVQTSEYKIYIPPTFYMHEWLVQIVYIQVKMHQKSRKLIKAPDAASLFKAIVQY